MSDIVITFNSIYNILREEKKNKSLNSLPKNFYKSLEEYFENKLKELERYKQEGNREKLLKERRIYLNSKRMVSELIELRLIKISKIGIINIINKNILLSETEINIIEKEFFKKIKEATKNFENEIKFL